MNGTCPNCSQTNPSGGHYCVHCGHCLSASLTQSHTVVMPAPAPPLTPAARQTILQRVTDAHGGAPTQIVPGMLGAGEGGSREVTELVFDVSGSMTDDFDGQSLKIDAAARAAVSLILQKMHLDADDEIGLITFNKKAKLVAPLCVLRSHKSQLIQAVQSVHAGGGTDINAGLKMARDHFDWHRSDVVRRVVLLTDGHGGNPRGTAAYLKERGVVIDVIGIGPSPEDVDERLLREVASIVQGHSRYRFISDGRTLVDVYTQLGGKTQLGF